MKIWVLMSLFLYHWPVSCRPAPTKASLFLKWPINKIAKKISLSCACGKSGMLFRITTQRCSTMKKPNDNESFKNCDKHVQTNEICEKFENCETCKDDYLDCVTCPIGRSGKYCIQDLVTENATKISKTCDQENKLQRENTKESEDGNIGARKYSAYSPEDNVNNHDEGSIKELEPGTNYVINNCTDPRLDNSMEEKIGESNLEGPLSHRLHPRFALAHAFGDKFVPDLSSGSVKDPGLRFRAKNPHGAALGAKGKSEIIWLTSGMTWPKSGYTSVWFRDGKGTKHGYIKGKLSTKKKTKKLKKPKLFSDTKPDKFSTKEGDKGKLTSGSGSTPRDTTLYTFFSDASEVYEAISHEYAPPGRAKWWKRFRGRNTEPPDEKSSATDIVATTKNSNKKQGSTKKGSKEKGSTKKGSKEKGSTKKGSKKKGGEKQTTEEEM